MSVILKALQRAEREQQYARRESPASVFWFSTPRARRNKKPAAAVLLAFVLAAGAGAWSLKGPEKAVWQRPERVDFPMEQQPIDTFSKVSSAPPQPVPPEDASGLAAVLSLVPVPAAELRIQPSEIMATLETVAKAASFQDPVEEKRKVAEVPLQVTVDMEGAPREGQKPSVSSAVEARLETGEVAEQEGRLDEAIAHFLVAVRARPGHAASHTALGRLYARKGAYILAINELRLAAEIAPGDSESLYALSVLYARLRSAPHARQYLEKAIARDAGVRQRALGEPVFFTFLSDPQFQVLLGTSTGSHQP